MQIGDGKKKKEKIHEARVSLVAIDKSYIESRCVLLVIDFQDGLSSLERVVVVIERKKERKEKKRRNITLVVVNVRVINIGSTLIRCG